jgi:hypothetical protein
MSRGRHLALAYVLETGSITVPLVNRLTQARSFTSAARTGSGRRTHALHSG